MLFDKAESISLVAFVLFTEFLRWIMVLETFSASNAAFTEDFGWQTWNPAYPSREAEYLRVVKLDEASEGEARRPPNVKSFLPLFFSQQLEVQ